MQASITQFRRDIFALVTQALEGDEVWILHKGQRLRITPEQGVGSRLDRITALQVVNPEAPSLNDDALLVEMTEAWERDWATL